MISVTDLSQARRQQRLQSQPLTAKRIRELKPRARQYWEPDGACPGLYVRVNVSGDLNYYVRGRVGGGRNAVQRNIRIGPVEQISLADARRRAIAYLAEMRAGNDPVRTAAEDVKLRDLVEGYRADLVRRDVVNEKHIVSSLSRNLLPILDRRASEVVRADLVRLIEKCHDKTGPAASVAFRGSTAAMLNWAVNTGLLKSSVLAGYKAPRRTRAQRVTSNSQFTLQGAEQVRQFWKATAASNDPVFRDFLRFLLLTGQRRTETAFMNWADLNGDLWMIPAEIRKNGLEHTVPLGPISLSILEAQVRRSDLVWPGRGDVPMSGWSKRLRPVKEAMAEPRLAMHALRRGYRTGLRELGADSDLSELMIGHTRTGLIARYDKSEMWEARISLQVSWERWVQAIVEHL